ncbi:MAG: methyltransferase domain-containing protein [Christensenellaceae bacterium]|nr:methyltransferase domain-containing protein [Christensenellaceae bacterium]
MNITQTFYDNMAGQYHKLFADWQAESREQAALLDAIFKKCGFAAPAAVLDCACGIGTQAIGLAELGYGVTGSDISKAELKEARLRADDRGVELALACADFCALDETFSEKFDIVICMDNALPHMPTKEDLSRAVGSMAGRLKAGGLFVASIRDYDALLQTKPPYSPPYIHHTAAGKRVSFQTWDWQGESYNLTQYIIDDGQTLQVSKFGCAYRATRREELTGLLKEHGLTKVEWKLPKETGFYQPMVLARK